MSLSTLGSSLVLAALLCAAFGGLVGMVTGLRGGTQGGLLWVRRAVWGFSAGMVLANLTMVYALLARDFSVQYVAQVGSHATPTIYTLVSLWSALEGSILFWGAVMGIYLMGFMLAHRDAGGRFMSLALGTQLLVGVFFAFLIAGPANPFLPTPPPIPLDGPGPNPMLQNHWLMVVHPPMLYLGYVGMTVPFGIVVAGLLSGELGERWMAPLRRWMLVPWLFLTFGIVMGAWWAYAVLGWGGYWAWDPVENASLLPWLTATAFLHSTLVQERRRLLRMWTATLALLTFWLTLLGTFMTRSGVFNSVHAFTQSDIGPTFLVFIAIVLVASLLLLTFRAPQLEAQGRMQALASREGGVLVNNLVLMALTFTVLLGTVFPLVVEAVQNKRISVGEPYFNRLAVPLGLMVLLLMGLGPALPWGAARRKDLRQLLLPTAVGVGVVALSLLGGLRGFYPLLTFGLAGFVTVVTLRQMFLPALLRMREGREGPARALWESIARSRRRFGGYIVHLGVVMVIVAVAASSSYVTSTMGTLKEGETLTLEGYQLRFAGLRSGREPHRDWVGAEVEVTTRSGATDALVPRLNYYARRTDPMGTPAVRSVPSGDLYLSLVTYDQASRSASLRAWVFPLVGWIWWSMPLFLFGTLLAVWPARRAQVVGAVARGVVPAGAAASATRGAA